MRIHDAIAGTLVGVLLGACLSERAVQAADLPVPDKATLYSGISALTFLSTSSDGRLVAGMEGSTLRVFDLHDRRTLAESASKLTASPGCTSAVGTALNKITGGYQVYVACSDGSIKKVPVSVVEDGTTVTSLSLGTATTLSTSTTGFSTLQATATNSTFGTWYLAGTVTTGSTSSALLKSLTLSSDTFSSIASSSGAQFTMKSLAPMTVSGTTTVYGASTDGIVYLISTSGYSQLINCSTSSVRQLFPLSSSSLVLLGDRSSPSSGSGIQVVSLSGGAWSCNEASWGLSSSPSALTAFTDRDANAWVLARATASTGDVAVFSLAALLQSPTSATASEVLDTSTTEGSSDGMITSPLGPIMVSTAAGVVELTAGPILEISGMTEAPTLTGDSLTVDVSALIDEPVSASWLSLSGPVDSNDDAGILSELLEGVEETLTLDLAEVLDGQSAGSYTVYVHALDADSNPGWTSFRVNYVERPEAPGSFSLLPGDQALYLVFTAASDTNADDYQVVFSTEFFTLSSSAELPDSFTNDLDADGTEEGGSDIEPNFTIDDTDWPGDTGWPVSLGIPGEDGWSTTDEGDNKVKLSPLTNGQEFCVAIRASVSDVGGSWTEVLCATPQKSLGAVEISDEAGGSCSAMADTGDSTSCSLSHRHRPSAGTMLSLGLGLLVLIRRRHRVRCHRA